MTMSRYDYERQKHMVKLNGRSKENPEILYL
jgi:hypothetical protein